MVFNLHTARCAGGFSKKTPALFPNLADLDIATFFMGWPDRAGGCGLGGGGEQDCVTSMVSDLHIGPFGAVSWPLGAISFYVRGRGGRQQPP